MRNRNRDPSASRERARPAAADRGWPTRSRERRSGGTYPYTRDGTVILYGWHTVKAALENPARHIHHLYATENALRRLTDDGVALSIEPELVRPDAIAAKLTADAVHQG